MKHSKTPIIVLKNFNGINAVIIDEVDRTISYGTRRDRKGNPHQPNNTISYQNKRYTVFILSTEAYGIAHPTCINIQD